MFLYFALLFLLLGNVLALKVIWKNTPGFDPGLIRLANHGEISTIELPTWNLIFPGTLWCGPGNISSTPDELGTAKKADACCRTHDMCKDVIKAGETRHGLTNDKFYSRLSCTCDLKFRNCLKKANTMTSTQVGYVYFTGLGTKCFRLDYPITGCKKKIFFPVRRCLEYKFDKSKKKKYQWFDLKPW